MCTVTVNTDLISHFTAFILVNDAQHPLGTGQHLALYNGEVNGLVVAPTSCPLRKSRTALRYAPPHFVLQRTMGTELYVFHVDFE